MGSEKDPGFSSVYVQYTHYFDDEKIRAIYFHTGEELLWEYFYQRKWVFTKEKNIIKFKV